MPGKEPQLQALQGSLLLGRHEGEAGGSLSTGCWCCLAWPGFAVGPAWCFYHLFQRLSPSCAATWREVLSGKWGGYEVIAHAEGQREATSPRLCRCHGMPGCVQPPRLLQTSPGFHVILSKNPSKCVSKKRGTVRVTITSKSWFLVVLCI